MALTASAAGLAPDIPPVEWFSDPSLHGPTALVVEPSGRVFGHLALWGSCHTGLPGCVKPPHSVSGYRSFHLGEIACKGGKAVTCGQITIETPHAPGRLNMEQAQSHYADTGAAVADIRAGEDEYGIWVAGAVRPDLSTIMLRKLRGAKLSGDWRWQNGTLEMIGALGVNIPGYIVPRPFALVASGRQVSLVAAGICYESCACEIGELLEAMTA